MTGTSWSGFQGLLSPYRAAVRNHFRALETEVKIWESPESEKFSEVGNLIFSNYWIPKNSGIGLKVEEVAAAEQGHGEYVQDLEYPTVPY